MFRRVRCLDCGFLAKHNTLNEGPDPLHPKYRDVVVPLPSKERCEEWIAEEVPGSYADSLNCWRRVIDVEEDWRELSKVDETKRWGGAIFAVVSEPRECSYFERFRPGWSFDLYLERQHRRGDRFWTVLVAFASAILGGLVAIIPVLVTR